MGAFAVFPKSRQHAILFVRYPSRIYAHACIKEGRARRQGGGALHHFFLRQVIEPLERYPPCEGLKRLAHPLHPKSFQRRCANHERDVVCVRQHLEDVLDKFW